MKLVHSRRTTALIGVAVSALVLAACGSDGDSDASDGPKIDPSFSAVEDAPPPTVSGDVSGPGVTDTTITIGQITTTSGLVPGLFQGADDGLDAYVAYLNANGGLAGRQVEVIHVDDTMDCNTYSVAVKDLSTKVFALVGGFSLVDQCGLKPLTADSELPYVGYTFVPSILALPNVFNHTPNPLGVTTTGWEWLKKTYPDSVDKVGTIVAPVSSVSAQTSRLTAESVGFTYAYSRELAANDNTNNFTADILKMKSEGVRIIDMFAASVPMITAFVQQAAQQGFEYDAVYGAAFDPRFLETIGDPSLAEGKVVAPSITPNFLAKDRNSDPVLNPVIKWLGETDAETELSLYAISAWSSGELFAQALAAAGEKVDRAALIDALGKVEDFDANGLSAPQQVGAKEGSPCIALMTVKDGSWVQAEADEDAVFDCSGSYHLIDPSELQ